MEVKIDKYGRIVIPKSVRDRLGLEPGERLELEVQEAGSPEGESPEGGAPGEKSRRASRRGETMRLRPLRQEEALERRGEALVHTGTADRPLDPSESVEGARQKRGESLAGETGADL